VQGIVLPVHDAVEAHCGEARGGERDDDPQRGAQTQPARVLVRRQHRAHAREREREQRVRQLDEARVLREPRVAGEGLSLPARRRSPLHRSIPNLGHSSSTFFFTASSISIRSGHGRVKPSSGHLRVPSMPILDPNPGPREAWSRSSAGPKVKRTSRSGSMLFSAYHHASCGLRTSMKWSTTTITLARLMSPWPQRPFTTLNACPGYSLRMLTKTRLWK